MESCCRQAKSHFNAQAALDLFEAEWDELIGKPSTISADTEDQVCLQTFLASGRIFLAEANEVWSSALPQQLQPSVLHKFLAADLRFWVQADRSHALDSAMNGGVVDGVTGWRRSFKGKRFQIEHATVFNISGPTGGEPRLPLSPADANTDALS